MARPRKNETSVNITPTGASTAPARRTSAATPHTRTAKAPAPSARPESQEEPAEQAVTAASEAIVIEYIPSHGEIAARAYGYWVERGYAEGCPEQDWLRAEAELRQRPPVTA